MLQNYIFKLAVLRNTTLCTERCRQAFQVYATTEETNLEDGNDYRNIYSDRGRGGGFVPSGVTNWAALDSESSTAFWIYPEDRIFPHGKPAAQARKNRHIRLP